MMSSSSERGTRRWRLHSAQQYRASVLVLEASGAEDQGGNTRYAAGQMRTVYQSVADMRRLVPDLTESEIASSDFGDIFARRLPGRCDAAYAPPVRFRSRRNTCRQ